MSAHIARIADGVEWVLGSVAVQAFRKPWRTLAALAVVTAISMSLMGKLAINADLAELLPSSFPSVQALETMRERFGGQGYVSVVASNAPPEVLRRFADDLAPKLEALPDIRYVDYRRQTEFFEKRALYYLDLDDLETIRDRLREREAYERRQKNPLYLDIEDEQEPPPLSFDDITQEYRGRGDAGFVGAQIGESHYLDPTERVIAILARPTANSLDVAQCKKLVAAVQEVLDGLDLNAYAPGLKVEIGGSYKKKVDQQDLIARDLGVSSTVALVLMLVFLAANFRRFSAVALVLVPLGLGLIWSYAFAAVAFGTLNILTAFIGAVLSGMGVENGIHLLGRFEMEWDEDSDREGVIRRTFGNTGRGVAVTAITTMVAFLGIALSEFRAFREFGVIAAVGMVLFVVSYAVALPALLAVALRLRWRPRTAPRDHVPRYVRWLVSNARAIFVCSMLALAAFATATPRLEFSLNLRSLLASNLRSFELDKTIDRLLGYSTTPAILLTNTPEEERLVAAELRRRAAALGAQSTVQFVAASADLVPDYQQDKQTRIAEIAQVLARVRRDKLSEADKKTYDLATSMTQAAPFSRADLPPEVTRQFQGTSERSDSGFVLAFASFDLSEGRLVRSFADTVRGIAIPGGKQAPVAGEAMVHADILAMVVDDAVPVLSFAIGLVLVALWLVVGNLRSAIACILPAAATLIVTLGIMPMADLSLNYINVVMIPLFFGIGIDGGAHLNTRLDTGEPFATAFAETGRGVTGSLLTNAFGFCALLIADHSGLNSLGKVALVGLAVNLLACNVALPAFVAWRLHRKAFEARHSAPPPTDAQAGGA